MFFSVFVCIFPLNCSKLLFKEVFDFIGFTSYDDIVSPDSIYLNIIERDCNLPLIGPVGSAVIALCLEVCVVLFNLCIWVF
nr:MAG TPA: hypothetical protein [Caudoviricetes sp.]DAX27256.1 MAG TPA: hypothetical protein [Caudoviricetes sp.]DAX94501.1 MAG TPA: hypothetical protein [Caudoviricetes sp.]